MERKILQLLRKRGPLTADDLLNCIPELLSRADIGAWMMRLYAARKVRPGVLNYWELA